MSHNKWNSNIIVTWLNENIFYEPLIYDHRIPIQLFSWNSEKGRYVVYLLPMTYHFHLQIFVLIMIQVILCALVSILTYYWLVVPQKQRQQRKPSNTSIKSFYNYSTLIVGYGFVIPMALYIPYCLMNTLHIVNKAIRTFSVASSISFLFKCLCIVHGNIQLPHVQLRTKSIYHFLRYMSFFYIPLYTEDDTSQTKSSQITLKSPEPPPQQQASEINTNREAAKTEGGDVIVVNPTMKSIVSLSISLFGWITALVWIYIPLISSDCLSTTYSAWKQNAIDEYGTSSTTVQNVGIYSPTFDILHLYHNYMTAWILFISFNISMYGAAIIVNIISVSQYDLHLFDEPLLYSLSPSDFWGRRWNRLVHICLKEGIYQPFVLWVDNRHYKLFAKFMTFLVSGLIHECMFALMFYQSPIQYFIKPPYDCPSCQTYTPIFGRHTIFFCWNGMLLVLEGSWIGKSLFQYLQKYFPRIVLGHIVVMMSLPVSHFFTDDLILGGYFDGIKHAIPLIMVRKTSI